MAREEKRSSAEKTYSNTVTALEGMYDFHPDCFDGLSDDDRTVLSRFYFAGRDIAVDDIFVYREETLKQDPAIQRKAQEALKRFYELQGIEPAPGEYSELDQTA